jgi:hypothetical protein
VGETGTVGTATFDGVSVDGVSGDGSAPPWRNQDVSGGTVDAKPGGPVGQMTETGGTYTVTGSGEIGPNPRDDDVVQISLFGVLIGAMMVIPVGVLFMTSEYKRGMIRTTFTACPRRARVLAAKALVLGVVSFGIGLVACLFAFLVAQPLLRDGGFAPPAFPPPALTDPPVLRAMVLSAAFLAAIAMFGVGVGTMLRHTAGAVTTAIALLVLPIFVASAVPAGLAKWIMLLTPTGGLAAQRAKPPTLALTEPWSMIGPWAGLGVACAYAAGSLLVGAWLLRRRDA